MNIWRKEDMGMHLFLQQLDGVNKSYRGVDGLHARLCLLRKLRHMYVAIYIYDTCDCMTPPAFLLCSFVRSRPVIFYLVPRREKHSIAISHYSIIPKPPVDDYCHFYHTVLSVRIKHALLISTPRSHPIGHLLSILSLPRLPPPVTTFAYGLWPGSPQKR